MTIPLLLALLLPGIYWDQGPDTIAALRQAGIECVHGPAGKAAAWRKAGFCYVPVSAAEFEGYRRAIAPGVRMIANEASATRSPWIVANGWRFERAGTKGTYVYEPKPGGAALAAAEAFAYGAQAVLLIDPSDLPALGRMLAFLKRCEKPPLPAVADVGVVDDGSLLVGEVMNLLLRRNVLFRAVKAPDPSYPINIQFGVNYQKTDAKDPGPFALRIRRELTDERRLLHIFGSSVVIGRVESDGKHTRIHLLNYGRNPVEGLRVRIRGSHSKPSLLIEGHEGAQPEDFVSSGGGTEFSVPEMNHYAIADLEVPVP
jgi:hypothetical protein